MCAEEELCFSLVLFCTTQGGRGCSDQAQGHGSGPHGNGRLQVMSHHAWLPQASLPEASCTCSRVARPLNVLLASTLGITSIRA